MGTLDRAPDGSKRPRNVAMLQTTPASPVFQLRSRQATAAWAKFVDLYTPLLFHWPVARVAGIRTKPIWCKTSFLSLAKVT